MSSQAKSFHCSETSLRSSSQEVAGCAQLHVVLLSGPDRSRQTETKSCWKRHCKQIWEQIEDSALPDKSKETEPQSWWKQTGENFWKLLGLPPSFHNHGEAGKKGLRFIRNLFLGESLVIALFFYSIYSKSPFVAISVHAAWVVFSNRAQAKIGLEALSECWKSDDSTRDVILKMRTAKVIAFGKKLWMSELMFVYISSPTSALTPWLKAGNAASVLDRWNHDSAYLSLRWSALQQSYPFLGFIEFPRLFLYAAVIRWLVGFVLVLFWQTREQPLIETFDVTPGVDYVQPPRKSTDGLRAHMTELSQLSDMGNLSFVSEMSHRFLAALLDGCARAGEFLGGPQIAAYLESGGHKDLATLIALNERSFRYIVRTIVMDGPLECLKAMWVNILGEHASTYEVLLALLTMLTSVYGLVEQNLAQWRLFDALHTATRDDNIAFHMRQSGRNIPCMLGGHLLGLAFGLLLTLVIVILYTTYFLTRISSSHELQMACGLLLALVILMLCAMYFWCPKPIFAFSSGSVDDDTFTDCENAAMATTAECRQ